MAQRILVVDDDPNALRLISYALTREGFEVIVGQNGLEALEKVTEQPVDLVVLDVMMPQMDGLEVCRRLRENPATARIPVIMLTAKAQVEDKIRGFKVGADDYITKPALPAELVARIRALLARAGHPTAAAAATPQAKVITFLGSKGGVGTTTLAVNVAIALAQKSYPVILCDMHFMVGAAAPQLGLRPNEVLLSVLKEDDKKPATSKAIGNCLVTHGSGLKVFPAPLRTDVSNLNVSSARAKLILDELSSKTDYLIIDAGNCLSPATLVALSQSDRIILVTETDYLALELVQQTAAALEKVDTHGAIIEAVMVNRSRSATVISKTEAEQRLNIKLVSFIIPAPEMCFQANRNRVPIMISQPGNLTVEQIRELAEHVAS